MRAGKRVTKGLHRTGLPTACCRGLPFLLLAAIEAIVGVARCRLARIGLPLGQLLLSYGITDAWLGATFVPFGAYVAYRRPDFAIGWLFIAFGALYGVSAYAIATLTPALVSGHYGLVDGWVLLASNAWTLAVAFCFPLILLLFPDGRLASPRWRCLVALALADGAVWVVAWVLQQEAPLLGVAGRRSRLISGTEVISNFGVLVVFILCAGALAHRWRNSSGRVHDQLMWLVAGAVVAVGLFLPTAWGVTSYWATSMLIGVPLFCVACTIALVRHQLFGIDLVVNRTLVYLVLSGVLLALYLGTAALARVTVGDRAQLGGSLAAAVLVAVVFVPARGLAQRLVDRLMFGTRHDPAQTLTTLAASLESLVDDELVAALQTLCQSLRLPYAAVQVQDRVTGTIDPTSAPERFLLRHRGQLVGELLVWPRRGQGALAAADRATLAVVGGPLATAVRSGQLSEQLQESRQEILAIGAAERARLHRELHDGLGPVLTAVALKAEAAGNVTVNDPSRARALLDQIGGEARAAVGDVRRIAHGLRPPALDRYGLLVAVSAEVDRFTSRLDGQPLAVTVDAPDLLPGLSDDVAVAAYRIICEALTNVARHSNASRALVTLRADGALHLEIADNGSSAAVEWLGGFGLASMARRAADCGGSLTAGPGPVGGRVRAVFPLLQETSTLLQEN